MSSGIESQNDSRHNLAGNRPWEEEGVPEIVIGPDTLFDSDPFFGSVGIPIFDTEVDEGILSIVIVVYGIATHGNGTISNKNTSKIRWHVVPVGIDGLNAFEIRSATLKILDCRRRTLNGFGHFGSVCVSQEDDPKVIKFSNGRRPVTPK